MTAAGVTLTLDVPEQPLMLDADATRISQVVPQPADQRREVHAVRRPGDRGRRSRMPIACRWWCATPASASRRKIRRRVFGMFVQLNRDMRRSQTGLGIGLTLVKQMTELHGGSVAVWSAGLGKGSEFTIHLPLADAVDSSRRRADRADPQSFAKLDDPRRRRQPGRRRQPRVPLEGRRP